MSSHAASPGSGLVSTRLVSTRLVSTRQAAAILAQVGLTREQSRRLLAAGLAGAGIRTSSSVLYDEARVRELAGRPCVRTALAHALPVRDPEVPGARDLFVARVGEARTLDVEQPRADQLAGLSGDWDIAPLTRVWLRTIIATRGFVPFVATVSGYVALGANLTGVAVDTAAARAAGAQPPPGDRGCSRLALTDPGAWFDDYAGRRLPTGPGGAWVWRVS